MNTAYPRTAVLLRLVRPYFNDSMSQEDCARRVAGYLLLSAVWKSLVRGCIGKNLNSTTDDALRLCEDLLRTENW